MLRPKEIPFHEWFYLPVLLMLFMSSCARQPERQAVAKVFDKYLYLDEVSYIFPEKVTREDSAALAQLYIENWIKTQLLLNKAEINLAEEQMSINKEIEEYRSSLLIFRYKEAMVNAKLDTVVTEKDILDYYEENLSNFIQMENLVKGVYIKLPLSAPNPDRVKIWLASSKEQDIRDLDNYCYTFASKYDYFDDDWVSFSAIQAELPEKTESRSDNLRSSQLIEQSDSVSRYIVYIKECLFSGETAPLNQVRNRVRDIILNKRKVELLTTLEHDIYMDALQKKHFEIFTPKEN